MSLGARISAFLALGASACTLLYGPSDAEFSSGTKVVSPTTDGGKVAPSSDGGDSGLASSSSSSSGSTTDSGGAPFVCPANASVCADFEDGTTGSLTNMVGDVVITPGGRDGTGHALVATLKANAPSPYVFTTRSPSPASGIYSFWFKAEGPIPDPTITFRLAHALWGNSCDWQLTWAAALTNDGLVEQAAIYDATQDPSCGPTKFSAKPLLTPTDAFDGQWHHVVGVMDATTATRTTSSTADGNSAATESLASSRAAPPTTMEIGLGIPCIQTTEGCFPWTGADYRVFFDEVTFTPLSP